MNQTRNEFVAKTSVEFRAAVLSRPNSIHLTPEASIDMAKSQADALERANSAPWSIPEANACTILDVVKAHLEAWHRSPMTLDEETALERAIEARLEGRG